jgi:hypothetical protein
MKTFVNLLKVFSLVALLSACAYENDPGLLPKITGKQDTIDPLKGKSPVEVLKTKYKTLSAVCEMTVALAPKPPTVNPAPQPVDPNPPVVTPEPAPAPGDGSTGPAPAPGDDQGTAPAPAPAPGDDQGTSPAPAPAPADPGPTPAPPPGESVVAAIMNGTIAAPVEQQAAAPIITPPKDSANEKVTVNFRAQADADGELKQIKDAVMSISLPHDDGSAADKLTANLTIEPLTFKDEETKVEGTVIYVMKHSPRMSAKVVISKTDSTGKDLGNETKDLNVIEGIKAEVTSEKAGATVSCDLVGSIDDKNELMKGQWLAVDCASKEAPKDNDAKAVYTSSCKDGKPVQTPPTAQGEQPPAFPPKS